MQFISNDSSFKGRRRQLRRNQTQAERLLWSKLRNKQFFGYKFYRQYSLGPYILDFYSHSLRLNIELYGGQHNEPAHRQTDASRTNFLKSQGITVLRYWNNHVLTNLQNVLENIELNINNSS